MQPYVKRRFAGIAVNAFENTVSSFLFRLAFEGGLVTAPGNSPDQPGVMAAFGASRPLPRSP